MSFEHTPPQHVSGLLDLGTAKVACLAVVQKAGGEFRVVGFGHQKSRGIKAGIIVDTDAAEDAVRTCLKQAEEMAGSPIRTAMVSAAIGRLTTRDVTLHLNLHGRMATPGDIGRAEVAYRRQAVRDAQEVLHLFPIEARVDGRETANLTASAAGDRLEVDFRAITGDYLPVQHVRHLVERCQVEVTGVAVSPLAAAFAVTTAADRSRGVIVIDCGAGTTGVTIFHDGLPASVHVHPIGSDHITFDLMRALDVPLSEAERIKKNYAIQIPAHLMPVDTPTYRTREGNHASKQQVTRAELTTIITNRIDALLRQVLARVQQHAVLGPSGGDILLTGGGSSLAVFEHRARSIFGCGMRCVRPMASGEFPQVLCQPPFAALAGLVALNRETHFSRAVSSAHTQNGTYAVHRALYPDALVHTTRHSPANTSRS